MKSRFTEDLLTARQAMIKPAWVCTATELPTATRTDD